MLYSNNEQLQQIADGMAQCGFKVANHNDRSLIVKTTQGQVLAYKAGTKVAGVDLWIELIDYDKFEVGIR